VTKKKRILIGVSGLALALAAGLVWWFWFMPPSKNDFVAAKTIAEKISTYKGSALLREYTSAVSAASKEGGTYEQIVEKTTGQKTKLLDALKSRGENAEKLESSRVRRDKDVEAAYAVYAPQEKKYAAYLQGYAESYPAYVSSFRTCNKIFQIGRQTNDTKEYGALHRVAAKDCLKDLEVLSKAPSKPFADYAKEFARIVNTRQKTFDGVENGSISYDEATESITKLGADLKKNDPNDEIIALSKRSLFHGELTKLIKVLGEKTDQAK
jgi:hypothetical protein